MIAIDEYVWPASILDAYTLLRSRQDAMIVSGGSFSQLTPRKIGLAIDLSNVGLGDIRETDKTFEIGAMVTLRMLETDERLNQFYDGVIARAASKIRSVQFRNLATVGGAVSGGYPFSDLIPVLLALDCHVILYQAGELPLADFLTRKRAEPDILEQVVIRKGPVRAAYQAFRVSTGSLPTLTVAVARGDFGFRIAVGARPGQTMLARSAMQEIQDRLSQKANLAISDIDAKSLADLAAAAAATEIPFADDLRATGAYRAQLCQVLVKRAILEVLA